MTVSGVVTVGGTPVAAGINDLRSGTTVATDSSGQFSFEVPSNEQLEILITVPETNTSPSFSLLHLLDASEDVVADIDIPADIVDLTVNIVDGDGNPLEGEVSAMGSVGAAGWDAQGLAPDGTVTLRVAGEQGEIRVFADDLLATMPWNGEPNITFTIDDANFSTVSGVITVNGAPVQANVLDAQTGSGTSADESGQFALNLPPSDSTQLVVNVAGSESSPSLDYFVDLDSTEDVVFDFDFSVEFGETNVRLENVEGQDDTFVSVSGTTPLGVGWHSFSGVTGDVLTIPTVTGPGVVAAQVAGAFVSAEWDGESDIVITLEGNNLTIVFEEPTAPAATTTAAPTTATTVVAAPTELALTGASSNAIALFGALMVAGGLVAIAGSRRHNFAGRRNS